MIRDQAEKIGIYPDIKWKIFRKFSSKRKIHTGTEIIYLIMLLIFNYVII